MPRGRRRRARGMGALAVVRQARDAAKAALESLRREIKSTAARLEQLIGEERSFRSELFGGGAPRAGRRGPGRPRKVGRPAGPKRRRRAARPKRPPVADAFFKKLPASFTLEQVRKVAGRSRSGISLAQWSRSKRIRKTAKGYQKTAK